MCEKRSNKILELQGWRLLANDGWDDVEDDVGDGQLAEGAACVSLG